MQTRYDRSRFDMRFYRGYASCDPVQVEDGESFVERVCGPCGSIFKDYPSVDNPRCFDCKNADNAYTGIGASIEVGCEDSTNPQRIREGTAGFNLGLRGIDKVVGRNKDGTPKLEYRPVANNELATARARREYAKQNGLTAQETSVKRAVGGR